MYIWLIRYTIRYPIARIPYKVRVNPIDQIIMNTWYVNYQNMECAQLTQHGITQIQTTCYVSYRGN